MNTNRRVPMSSGLASLIAVASFVALMVAGQAPAEAAAWPVDLVRAVVLDRVRPRDGTRDGVGHGVIFSDLVEGRTPSEARRQPRARATLSA